MVTGPDFSYTALAAYLETLPDGSTFADDRFSCPLATLAHHQGFPLVVVDDTTWRSLDDALPGGKHSAFALAFLARYDRLAGINHRVRTVKRILAELAPMFEPQEGVGV